MAFRTRVIDEDPAPLAIGADADRLEVDRALFLLLVAADDASAAAATALALAWFCPGFGTAAVTDGAGYVTGKAYGLFSATVDVLQRHFQTHFQVTAS